MNKILIGACLLSFSLAACQGKDKEKVTAATAKAETVENVESVNIIEEDMNKQERKKKIDIIVSGESLKDVDATIRAITNTIKAIERRDAIESADLEEEGGLAYESYPVLDRADAEIINEFYSQALQQAGVKKPSEEVFNSRLNQLFQINLTKYNDRKIAWKKINTIVLTPAFIHSSNIKRRITEDPYEVGYSDEKNYYFDIHNRFTTYYSSTPNFFRYVKIGDEVEFLTTIDQIYNKEKNEFKLSIPKFTIEYNKYVFHNDRSSFSWLLKFAPYSIKSLVSVFGYEGEPLLNGWVLNNVRKEIQEKEEEGRRDAINVLANLFAKKNYQNQVEIREGLMQYIEKSTTLDDNDLLLMLDDYASELVNFDNSYSDDLREGFTNEELYKIFAYSAYYSYKGFEKFDKGLGRFSSLNENWPNFCALSSIGRNEEVLEAFRKNNYYNIAGLKEAIEKIDAIANASDD